MSTQTYEHRQDILQYMSRFPLAVCTHCGELVCAYSADAEDLTRDLVHHIQRTHVEADERAREEIVKQADIRAEADHVQSLEKMLVDLVIDANNYGRDWRYMRFAAVTIGNSVLNVLELLGQDRHKCLSSACKQANKLEAW